jgi:hypothetical protein
MKQIKSLADLNKSKEEYLAKSKETGGKNASGEKIRIRVHMGTSGIASGARAIYEFLTIELEKRNIRCSR